MTTPLRLSPAADAAPSQRTPWRAALLLVLAVGLAHLALLGWMPVAPGSDAPSPLARSFVTRTIVMAPAPMAEAPKPEAVAPAAVAPRPKPKPAPARPFPKPQAATASVAPAPPEPAAVTSEPAAETQTGDGASAEASATGGAGTASGTAEPAPPVVEPLPPMPTAEAAALVPLRIPGSVRLKFAVTGQQGAAPMSGVFGELAWLQDGKHYDARLALTFFFKTLRAQHSEGAIGASGIEPERFSDTRKSELASHFVRDRGQVVFSNNVPPAPLMAGAQDRLSVLLQLGALLAGDPARFLVDGAIALQTVGARDADIWVFKVGDEEHLTLPAGDFQARKLTRNPRRPYDDMVEVWLAPALGYLPVRFKVTQSNGDFADMQLREQLPLSAPQ